MELPGMRKRGKPNIGFRDVVREDEKRESKK